MSYGWSRIIVHSEHSQRGNEVIRHNQGRKSKTLWTANGDGDKVHFHMFMSSFEEGEYVAGTINAKVPSGKMEVWGLRYSLPHQRPVPYV